MNKSSKPINAPSFVVPNSTVRTDKNVPKPIAPPTHKSNGIFDLLNIKNMTMDSDRSLILMMLALLYGKTEDADDLLVMALLYIMF